MKKELKMKSKRAKPVEKALKLEVNSQDVNKTLVLGHPSGVSLMVTPRLERTTGRCE